MPFKIVPVFLIMLILPAGVFALGPKIELPVKPFFHYAGANTKPVVISDSWWTKDKGQHFAGSLITTVFLGKLSQQSFSFTVQQGQVFGGGISFALGLGKEIYDSRNPGNRFSVKDLVADIAGITAGIILLGVH